MPGHRRRARRPVWRIERQHRRLWPVAKRRAAHRRRIFRHRQRVECLAWRFGWRGWRFGMSRKRPSGPSLALFAPSSARRAPGVARRVAAPALRHAREASPWPIAGAFFASIDPRRAARSAFRGDGRAKRAEARGSRTGGSARRAAVGKRVASAMANGRLGGFPGRQPGISIRPGSRAPFQRRGLTGAVAPDLGIGAPATRTAAART